MLAELIVSGALIFSRGMDPALGKVVTGSSTLLAFVLLYRTPENVDNLIIDVPGDDSYQPPDPCEQHKTLEELMRELAERARRYYYEYYGWLIPGQKETAEGKLEPLVESDIACIKPVAQRYHPFFIEGGYCDFRQAGGNGDNNQSSSGQKKDEGDKDDAGSSSGKLVDNEQSSSPPESAAKPPPTLAQIVSLWRGDNRSRLGQGTFADVFMSITTMDGKRGLVACKVAKENLPGGVTTERVNESLRTEAKALATLPHPGIVNFLGVREDSAAGLVVLFLELLPYSLGQIISLENPFTQVPHHNFLNTPSGFLNLSYCLISVLGFLYHRNCLYLDLRSENVRISRDGDVKLIDFGCLYNVEKPAVMKGVKDTHYLAPELREGKVTSLQGLVFGIGLLILELLQQVYLEDRPDIDTIIDGYRKNDDKRGLLRVLIRRWDESVQDEYVKVLQEVAHPSCQVDPSGRPDFEAIKDAVSDAIDRLIKMEGVESDEDSDVSDSDLSESDDFDSEYDSQSDHEPDPKRLRVEEDEQED